MASQTDQIEALIDAHIMLNTIIASLWILMP
jgi:hypothetical protein